jgi:RHS repeat-associated protein
MEYTPYGEKWIQEESSTNIMNYITYKFTSKELDEETGLYYFGARYYDAQTSRWMSADPGFLNFFPIAPVNNEAKEHNKKLPGEGGVYNPINLNQYCYAGNNPIKYFDPNGNEIWTPWDYFSLFLFNSGTEGKFAKVHYDAAMGNENAQQMVKMIWYEASVKMSDDLSDTMDYTAIACLAIGQPEGALAAKIVGTAADISSLALRFAYSMDTGDYTDFMANTIIKGSSYVIGAVISEKLTKISIRVGKNGLYYQLGRSGALKKWDAIKKDITKKLSPEIGDKATEEILKKIYEMIKPVLNDKDKNKK